MLPDESDVGRFAYKSIRIQVDSHTSRSFRRHDLGRFAYIEVVSHTVRINDIKVDSHTQFELICIHNLSWFAYKKVDSPTQSKFEVILCSEHYSRWLTTRARTFFLNIARIDKKWTLKKLLKSENKFQQA